MSLHAPSVGGLRGVRRGPRRGGREFVRVYRELDHPPTSEDRRWRWSDDGPDGGDSNLGGGGRADGRTEGRVEGWKIPITYDLALEQAYHSFTPAASSIMVTIFCVFLFS